MLETNTNAADTPSIAVNGNGDAMVVWAQARGPVYDILARFYRHNDGWDTIRMVETDLNGTEKPRVAIDPDGNAIAVYREYDGSHWNIMANTYDPGSGNWNTTPQRLDQLGTDANDPMIAMSANGDAVAVWWQYDTVDWSIFANHYNSTTHSWDATATIIDHGGGDAYEPKVAMDDHGNAVAIWQQHDGTMFGAYANHYSAATGQWLTNAVRLDGAISDIAYQTIAMDANGNAVALWTSTYQGTIRLFANQYIVGDTWQGVQIIQDDNRTANQCTVAYDASGNAMALWTQSDPTGRNLYANRLPGGSTAWSGSVLAHQVAGEEIHAPVLHFDTQGNGVVTYLQMKSWIFDVYALRYSPTQGWWGATLLEDNKKDARQVDLGVDDAGNGFAVWRQSDGSNEHVFYNRLH
jgi:hypothetical protein